MEIIVLAAGGEPTLERIMKLNPRGLAYDSRRVEKGYIFFAIKGLVRDGHDFIPEAVARGAIGIVAERKVEVPPGVVLEVVPNTRRALAWAAAQFYGHPSRKLHVVGVTGTNGKTTTTHLLSSLYQEQGKKVGLIGTLYVKLGEKAFPGERTTPESLDLQSWLARMVEEGIEVAVMEVSSHGLALERVTGVAFDVAVFTNLTQDHLDFHRDLEDYFQTKARLFTELLGEKPGKKLAVINRDDPYGQRLTSLCRGVEVLTYGLKEGEVHALDYELRPEGTRLLASAGGERVEVKLSLPGIFNVYNALAALAVAVGEGMPLDLAARALSRVQAVPGRCERIDEGQDFTVLVDYAHTPDGLLNILRTAREISRGRVIVVFGCGGDRDPSKRPVMGRIAGEYADLVVVTSDNPRSEDPVAIMQAIAQGLAQVAPPSRYLLIEDREAAIKEAFARARPGDIVILAGKGHENCQIIGDKRIPFDDREVARRLLREMKSR
ncbi:UDP-N-acetylmuramyl-tripeptide synthetase [Ammonifex degensii KC4]|uniref:UDP-N-acetylmuramoyl-L-alanyl-D-glutamate--2,6-diaminopimelate ligase n=2 Tax=Ammonifex degensii TaxID=42838 RepID=C9R8N5_AMMDK|nr:UDP-N-acetylmuramyl-tripeptide synthetase [Ammonifex degensii KC4]